jgi:hypothetical protein
MSESLARTLPVAHRHVELAALAALHTASPVFDWGDRMCVCDDSYDDHEMKSGRGPWEPMAVMACTAKGCACREFSCWEHSDNACAEPLLIIAAVAG